jgi:hypothetical protein
MESYFGTEILKCEHLLFHVKCDYTNGHTMFFGWEIQADAFGNTDELSGLRN